MSHPMSLEEFAALVNIDPEQISEWTKAGLLDPAGTGQFGELDLLRLMTIRHYEALGYSTERLIDAIDKGEVEPFLAEYIYPKGPQLTLEEAAARLEMAPESLVALRRALGWTRDFFLEEDLRLVEAFKAIAAAGLPREALEEGSRVFGDALRRLAEAEVRLVHVHIHERLLNEGLSEQEVARRIASVEAAALPLLDRIVERVHHEHFLQASIEDAFVHLVDTETAGGPGSVDATIVFVDVESFTQLAEREGDQVAMETMTRIDSMVRGLALDHHGKVVKNIGDALMLAFRRPDDAVGFADALHLTAYQDASMPGLRIGMHHGPAIYRGGDYIGTTVNLASRVTSTATAGQTVMTEAVAEYIETADVVEPLGVRMLRGADRPMQLYRLAHREERRDPVCGRIVQPPPAARLREGDDEVWFCSEECLRKYLSTARAAV